MPAYELLRQRNALGLRQFARQGKLYLARQHGILAALDRFHLVPQPLTRRTPCPRTCRPLPATAPAHRRAS